MGDLTKNFSKGEFACHHCGQVIIKPLLVDMLQVARDICRFPFAITSGYRCAEYNARVGGQPHSAHTRGLAADVKCPDSRKRYLMLRAMFSCGFKRIGIGKDYIHVDIDPDLADEVIWMYY